MRNLLNNIKRIWKVIQILSDQSNINLFEKIITERKIKMKTIQELLALKRELTRSINNARKDEIWNQVVTHPDIRLEVLLTRLKFVDNIIANFGVYDWVFNSNTGVTRAELIDPSLIVISDANAAT